jgi:HK97 family phage portal protein
MTPTIQLDTDAYQSRVLMTWLASQPGAMQRAGVQPLAGRQAGAGVSNLIATSGDNEAMRALFAPLPASSGFAVTDYTSMLVSTIFACLSKISGAMTQLPVHQYRIGVDGDRERMAKTPLWWLLNESPDAQWTAASWREWIVRCVHLRGDQHTQIIRRSGASAGGEVIGLRPLHPDNVRVRCEGGRNIYDVFDPETGHSTGVDQDDMLHFTGFGFDGKRSLSVVQHAARNSIGNALAASDFTGRQLGEGAMPKIALSYPNKLNPDQADLLRKSFVAAYSGPGSQKLPLIMTEGGKAEQLTWSAVDLELLASRRFEREDMCQACGVPPVLIGENEKTSSWGTGVEQITLGFVKFTVSPHLVRWSQELNRKLFRRAGMFVEFDLDALLRGDSKAQAEAFRAALGGPGTGDGWMSVDEVRRLKNLPPLDTEESSKPFRAQRAQSTPAQADPMPAALAGLAGTVAALASREPAPAVINVTPAPISVQAGDTHMHIDAGAIQLDHHAHAPAITLGDTAVHIDAGAVQVANHVQTPAPGATRQTITRDAAGDIAEIVTHPTDD